MTLQPLAWSAPATTGHACVKAVDGDATWRVTPVPRDVVRISYEGKDADGTLVIPSTDQAYAESVDEAAIVIDILRAGTADLKDWRVQLQEAGFTRTYPDEPAGATLACIWHDERRAGLFNVVVKNGYAYADGTVETSVHATYESGRATFWHNVCRITAMPHASRVRGPLTIRDGLPEGVDALKAGVAAAIAIRAARRARGGRFADPIGGAPKSRAA